ncbi:hypothetical protein B566_EDAN002593 [Ephemera danica]|nr:hypothetical protein B566_EDAN002593 [Ephemera danica]
MRSTEILVLLFFITGPWCIEISAENHPCPQKLSLELVDAELQPDKSISAGGRRYPPETYWQDGTSYFGCPCLITRCLRKCPALFDSGGIKEIQNRTPFKISISHEDRDVVVNGHEHFEVFEGDVCEINKTSALDPEYYHMDRYKILSNGSLYYTNLSSVEGPEHFCVQIFEDGTIEGVAICLPPGEGLPPKEFQHYLYPALLLISVFFLILTLITYLFTPERNLHSRCMTVHCVCLAIGSFGLAIIQIAGQIVTKTPCYLLGTFKLYFKLFLVMGLSWTFEIISWLGKMAGAPAWTWYLTDSINCLQGFFIFVLCVWFTKSRNILLQRLCCKRFADEFRVTTITQQPGASACTKSSDASESGHPQSYSMKSLKSNRSQFD